MWVYKPQWFTLVVITHMVGVWYLENIRDFQFCILVLFFITLIIIYYIQLYDIEYILYSIKYYFKIQNITSCIQHFRVM